MNHRIATEAQHPSHSRKPGLAKLLGTIFLLTCLIASAVAVGLPQFSKAASGSATVKAAADTFATSRRPDKGYGRTSRLEARGDPRTLIFLRFAVNGLGANSVAASHLRLYTIKGSDQPVGLKLFSAAADWDEQALSWQQQPALGAQVAELAPAPLAKGQWVDFDLGQLITGDGTYAFALSADTASGVQFRSRERAEAPELALTTQPGVAPSDSTAPAPTAVADPADDADIADDAADTAAPDEGMPVADAALAADTAATAAAGGPLVLVQPATGGYLGSSAELAQRIQLANQGVEPYKSAYSNVVAFANGKLGSNPSPQNPLNIGGTTGPFVDDTATAYGLALAYSATGDARYAQKARAFIMAWVTTTKSTTNTCTNSGSCQTSLIISRVAPGFVFAANLIKPSGAFSAADDTAFRGWLRSVILPTASTRTNNWGDAGTFMRIAVTDYLGDAAGFSAAIAKWKSLVDLIAADGHIPEETRRGTSGLNYTQEALDYKVAAAVIAQRRGIDLWSYGRFKLAIDYAAKYVTNPSAWPWASGASSSIHPLWEVAYQRWQNPAYQPIIKQRRPYGADGHSAVRWTTLTNGLPF
ncbi:alginate lyase family protein [Kouleothrix sp.]|uniref:alginate lyase family protein n=1 Tax=Kouleothrix sp. TaxID=2779161 RepID=UPI00391890AD